MSIEKLPSGTRGARNPPGALMRILIPAMMWVHRRRKNRFRGTDLLYLTTVGARSGQRRTNPVAVFDDGKGGWVIVASVGGAVSHPGWYHNIVAHPDQVLAEVSGVTHQVTVVQLAGAERDAAWATVVARAPGFAGYEAKTDRPLPVLRLTPADAP